MQKLLIQNFVIRKKSTAILETHVVVSWRVYLLNLKRYHNIIIIIVSSIPVLLTSFATSLETLHNANSLRNRCDTSNRSAAGPELSADRRARWTSNTVAAAVVPISISICAPNSPPPVVFAARSINAFLCILISDSSILWWWRFSQLWFTD